jgi:hypothetical protein
MSSLFILLFIIAAMVSAPLLIVMLVVKLTEAEHKKEKIKKIAEENKQPDKKNVVITHLTAALQHFISPDQHKDLSGSDHLPVKQQPITGKNSTYVPNHIPSAVRTESAVLALFLLGYGVVAWFLDGMYLPAKRGGFVIHGLALNLMVLAMICAALNLAAIVVDHYDHRNNERHYITFSKVTRFLGWTLFALALAADFSNFGN